jgi:hypothetical protein
VKQLRLLVVVIVSFNALWSKEVKRAPTVEQCRADQKLWLSRISDDAKAEEAEGLREPVAASISFQQLNFCSLEMHDCARIDPEFKKEYCQTSDAAVVTANNRLVHFLYRHNLNEQFLAEDAQGKR